MAVSGAYYTISSCPRPLLPIPRCGPSSSSKPTLKLQSLASSTLLAAGAGAALAMSAFLAPEAALAALEEPTNALSLPTWAIHVSSVVEWYWVFSFNFPFLMNITMLVNCLMNCLFGFWTNVEGSRLWFLFGSMGRSRGLKHGRVSRGEW